MWVGRATNGSSVQGCALWWGSTSLCERDPGHRGSCPVWLGWGG